MRVLSWRARALVVAVLVAVVAGGCAHGSRRGSAGIESAAPAVSASAGTVPIVRATPGETATPTGTPTATPTATPTTTPTGTATPKPAQTTPAPAAPKVTHVALSVDDASQKNVNCHYLFTFSGTISVSGGPVTVKYAWRWSNSKGIFTGSVKFGPGGPQHATVQLPVDDTGSVDDVSLRSWMNFSVTGPNAMAAPNANVFLDCVPATEDLQVNMPAGPGACGGHVTTMSFLVIGFPHVPVSYTIEWGDGTHQTGTTTLVPPLRSSIVDSHHTYAAGTYTVHVWAGASGDSGVKGDSESLSFTCS